MGSYNPHQPYILGEEWVPIRDEQLHYSPNVNTVERGVAFTAAATRQVRTARFYVNTLQPTTQSFQTALVGIYPYGLEDQTGPIRQVIIPVNAVSTTGANISIAGGAATIPAALAIPGDGTSLGFNYNTALPQDAAFWFNISAYPELANKRILNVSLLYAGSVFDVDAAQLSTAFVDPDPSTYVTNVRQRNDVGSTGVAFTPPSFYANTGVLTLATSVDNATAQPTAAQLIQALNIGDINNFYEASPGITTARRPWRYLELLKFEQSYPNASRQHIFLRVQLPATAGTVVNPTFPSLGLDYLAMRVIYCEEKRVAYGAQRFGYAYGVNQVTMYDQNFNTDPILTAGQYLPTLSWVNPGEVDYGAASSGDFPDLNALTELYQIPTHPAVELAVPFPLAERLGETFTSTSSHLLPQLSLHASGGTLTEPHVYGRQAAAQVYGVNTATQDIYDLAATSAASYPQVRYYARRFGDTTIPLTLGGCSGAGMAVPGTSGSYASTPDTAALDITPDIDMRADVTLANWTSGVEQSFLARTNGGLNQRVYWLRLDANGFLNLLVSNNGTGFQVNKISTVLPTPGACGRLTVRATMDGDNGGGANTVTFYTGTAGVSGAFTQLGAADSSGGTMTIFNGNIPLEAGAASVGTVQPMTGILHAAQLRNGIAGAIVANPDFEAQAPGTTNFVDSAGLTWTVNGTAAIVAANTGSTVSITVSDFDELAEILDGWREVTLRFTSAPTMGGATSSFPSYTWSAVGETSGNRWEVLAASAPAVSGTPGNNYNLAPLADRLGVATYQPPVGDTVELTWMPQGIASGWVTGSTIDKSTDAVLIFSQDPATVTGVSLSQLTQSVSGIGGLCGGVPCCIPTGIGYHQLSWSASTLPASGFGAYELQRWDSVTGGDFATIMLSTTVSGTSFKDWEARVGVTAVYRIRTLNVLNFAGLWSTYVSGAPPAPGVTGGCGSQDGVLIFTSNADQTGADNAAYVMQWDSTPVEGFDLPEADMVTFQPMYGRDGSIAFHGTERGLEEFSRNVLLQAGAIALPSLADAADIRDLAWAQLPYVCVRDDRGNRWFSNVRVNGVNARNNAQNYMASLAVTETTRTPYPVDP